MAACHKVYATLERRDRLIVRVTPTELIVDDIGLGTGTIVEHEIVRRLHRAHIASIDFDRSASIRDFSRFCADLLSSESLAKTKTSLVELLTDHGVETIVPHLAQRPEVLDVGAPAPSVCTLVENERRRRESAYEGNAPVNHLYPPDKGWVRLDPASQFDIVSLTDLAVLVNDPVRRRHHPAASDRRRSAARPGRAGRRSSRSSPTSRRCSPRSIRGWPASCSASSRGRCSTSIPSAGRRCCRGRFSRACSTAAQTATCFVIFRTSISPNRCACCSSSKPPRPKC